MAGTKGQQDIKKTQLESKSSSVLNCRAGPFFGGKPFLNHTL